MKHFDQDVAKQIAFKEATKRTPDRMTNLVVMLGGVALAIVLLMFCFLMAFSGKPVLQFTGILGVVLILAAVYAFLSNDRTWQTVETITGHDLNQDGYIGAPPQTHIQFQASERTTWMSTLPAPEHLILEWAAAALNGRSLGYRQWRDRFALLPDKSDGMKRYAEFRDALVRGQLAIEGGKSGISLTDRGIQQFTEYVHQRPRGTPLLGE